jgi:hypothetical protein
MRDSEMSLKRGNLPAVATLLALTTIIPELFTGSTPAAGFLNPGLLLILFLGYGLAVLLVRELAVRWRCGILGLFFLGLAYSILNEGLFAKTSILTAGLPVPQYDHYGYVLGVSLPWIAGMGTWHAFASVIFPICMTYFLFPQTRDRPWLSTRVALVLVTLLLLLACTAFLGTSQKGVKGTPGQLSVLLLIMCAGILSARRFKGQMHYSPSAAATGPFVLGLSVMLPFWTLAMLASWKVPQPIFYAALAGTLLLYGKILERRRWLDMPSFLFFAMGWYVHNALQAAIIVAVLGHNPGRALVAGVLQAFILLLLIREIRRSGRAEVA